MESNKTRVRVINFDERYIQSYIDLKLEWIQRYFEIEPMDVAQLKDPYSLILNQGGEIFFVIENEAAVGVCAMIPHEVGSYELAKMAVDPKCRGRGYGDLLMDTAWKWAKEKGASHVKLLSNRLLEPAIKLYKKHGFRVTRVGSHPDYKRSNVEMELTL